MRVYSNFQKAIREAIKQRYAEGNPKLIREDVANIAKSFGKSAEEATATLADMETQIRNNFLDNSTRKEERIKPTLFSQINAIGAPVQQAVDRGIRNKADQQELTKLVERTSNLAAYQARTIGRTAAMGKARGEYLLTHLRNGCRQFRYAATSSHPATPPRAFCQAHTGEVIHINEINKMNNGQGLPVIFYMGGYNCTHTWEAVYNLEEVKKQQASKPAPKVKAKAKAKIKSFVPPKNVKFSANSSPADVFTEESIDRFRIRKETSEYSTILRVSSPKAVYSNLNSLYDWDARYILQFVASKTKKDYIREQCEDMLEQKYYPSEKQRWGIAYEFIANKESVSEWVSQKIKDDLKFYVESAASEGEEWNHPFLRIKKKSAK